MRSKGQHTEKALRRLWKDLSNKLENHFSLESTPSCPSFTELQKYARKPNAGNPIASHLKNCARCARIVTVIIRETNDEAKELERAQRQRWIQAIDTATGRLVAQRPVKKIADIIYNKHELPIQQCTTIAQCVHDACELITDLKRNRGIKSKRYSGAYATNSFFSPRITKQLTILILEKLKREQHREPRDESKYTSHRSSQS